MTGRIHTTSLSLPHARLCQAMAYLLAIVEYCSCGVLIASCHSISFPSHQENLLKEQLREAERSQRREAVDLTYLKNVVLKLIQSGSGESWT